MSEQDRYRRQEILPDVGREGQARLGRAHAAVVGLGALGCAAADHLARAGVGRMTLIDRDMVEWTNLQRQSLYEERDAAERLPKAEAAHRRLAAVNSGIELVSHIADLTPGNAEALLAGGPAPGVIVDGTDNFETRFLLNDVAVKHGVPYVYGGVVGTRGMQMTIRPGATACLRCVFDEPPPPASQPTCDTAGVLGPAVGIVGACEASDALRVLLGRGATIPPTLLEFDLWEGRRRRLDLSAARREDCVCCGRRLFEFLEGGRGGSDAVALCGRDAVQVSPPPGGGRLDLEALAGRLAAAGAVTLRPFMLRCALAGEMTEAGGRLELTIFRDGRTIVQGTTRPERARSVYAKYVGA